MYLGPPFAYRHTTRFAAGMLAAILVAATVAPAAAQQIQMNFDRISWQFWPDEARQKFEIELVAAAERLATSNASIATAVGKGQHLLAARAVVRSMDSFNWGATVAVIRGCDPSGALCFVISCRDCST